MAATFEQDWQSKNRPALLAAHNTLTSLHARLVDNINQQTSASAADGGWTAARIISDVENVLAVVGVVGTAIEIIPGASEAVSTLLGAPVEPVIFGAELVESGLEGYQPGDDTENAGEYLAQGQYVNAANSFVYGVADGLETDGEREIVENPPLGLAYYGAGVDLKLADEVANLDWKDTPNPLSGSNFEQDYVPVLKSMGTGAYWEQAANTLWEAARP